MEIRQLARQFAESELRPNVERWDHDGAVPAETLAQLEELGFLTMIVAEADGGMGFDLPTYVAAIEELAWGEPGVALLVATANESACRGETRPDNFGRLAMAGGEQRGMFLRPAGAGGEPVATLGFRTVQIVRGDANAAGEPAASARLAVAAIAVGIAQAALEHARGYADIREQFKTKLREFEGIQFKLAEMAMRTEAARALLQHAVADASADRRAELAAMAKLFASETAMWVSNQAVQIFGGYGYMKDYPVEKLMRDAKATEMLEGANEALRVMIARNLYNQEGIDESV